MITSVPVRGCLSGRLFSMVLGSRDFGYPPIFIWDALNPLVAPPSGYKLPFQRYGTFKSVKNAKCVSRPLTEGRRAPRGQVWRVQRSSNLFLLGSRFKVLFLVRFRSYGRKSFRSIEMDCLVSFRIRFRHGPSG